MNRLIVLLYTISCVLASGAPPVYGSFIATIFACDDQIVSTATYCPHAYGPECYCLNIAALGTLIECFVQKNANTTSNIKELGEFCAPLNVSLTESDFYAVYENATKYSVNITSLSSFNATEVINYPIKLDQDTVLLYEVSYARLLSNYNDSTYYGAAMIAYWGIIFLIAIVSHWTNRLYLSKSRNLSGPVSNAWRKYITLATTGQRKRMQSQKFLGLLDHLVPSRVESLIVIGFTLVTIAVNTANLQHIPNNPILVTVSIEVSRYCADRTGITVGFIIPLLILFGGRNNFLQWITGWNYQIFMTYHRWVSRIVVALVFIHTVGFTVSYWLGGYYFSEMKDTYLIWGTIGFIASCFSLFQALLFFRRRWYEVFLLLHLVLAGLFIAGSWIHVRDLGYTYFYYASVAVWAFDYLLRIMRIIAFRFPSAECKLITEDTMRVTIKRPSYWKSFPGGYVFINFLRPNCFWQSHPFTYVDSHTNGETITLYCKVKKGVTYGICQYLKTMPEQTAKISVTVEGPYGEPGYAKNFKNAIFIAGGNGIPGMYSEICDLTHRQDNSQHLKLYWIIRDCNALLWFSDELLKLKDTNVEIIIYVTSPLSDNSFTNALESSDNGEDNSRKGSKQDEAAEKTVSISQKMKDQMPNISFVEGRPDIEDIVAREIVDSDGSIAFATCGPAAMVDDIRFAVRTNLDNPKGYRVGFFERLQLWA